MELTSLHPQLLTKQDDLDLLKDTLTQDLTPSEFLLFVRTCQHTGLDPFQHQIYAFMRKYKDKNGKWQQKLSIQTGIDGFRLIADRTRCYAPGRETTYTYDEKGNVESATAYIKKFVGSVWHEVAETAFMEEYKPAHGQDHMWRKMPRVMLAKVAEARSLRRAFPAEMYGLYTRDEMAQSEEPEPTKKLEAHVGAPPEVAEVILPQLAAPQINALAKTPLEIAPSPGPGKALLLAVKPDPVRKASLGVLHSVFRQAGFGIGEKELDRQLRLDFSTMLLGTHIDSFKELRVNERGELIRKMVGIKGKFDTPEMVFGFAHYIIDQDTPILEGSDCNMAIYNYLKSLEV